MVGKNTSTSAKDKSLESQPYCKIVAKVLWHQNVSKGKNQFLREIVMIITKWHGPLNGVIARYAFGSKTHLQLGEAGLGIVRTKQILVDHN